MCRTGLAQTSVSDGQGDEIWACDTETEESSCGESEIGSMRRKPVASPQSQPSKMAQKIISKAMSPIVSPSRSFQVRKAASAQSPSKLQQLSVELACRLRKDNERLREMLVDAQQIAEEVASVEPTSGADFAHLLELAKEFEPDFATFTNAHAEENSENVESDVSMNAEQFRLDDDDDDERDLHLQKLKAQIAAAKTELARVNAAALRAEPDSDSSDDESDSDAECSDDQKGVAVTRLPKPVDRSDGYWTSSKTGQRHHISWRFPYDSRPVPGCTQWQAVQSKAATLTLEGSDGKLHSVERLHTRMLGEALLWDSGELWSRQR